MILIERFGFEMKKRYDQTELQLLLSPSVLLVSDNVNRSSKDKNLNHGKLALSSLQVTIVKITVYVYKQGVSGLCANIQFLFICLKNDFYLCS